MPRKENARVRKTPGGGHAAVRVQEVEHPDPDWVCLELEAWPADASGEVDPAAEAVVKKHSISRLQLSELGAADALAARLVTLEDEGARRVDEQKRSRAVLAGIPKKPNHLNPRSS